MGQDMEMERRCRIEGMPPGALPTARQPPFRVVVPTATARRALAGRPLHSKRAVRKARNNCAARYNFACGLARDTKDKETALELLGPVFAKTSMTLLNHAKVDPDLDSLRDDPRFPAMIAAAETRLAAEDHGGSPPANR